MALATSPRDANREFRAEAAARPQRCRRAVLSAAVENSGSPHRRGDWTKQSDVDWSADILPIERRDQVGILGNRNAAAPGFRNHRSPILAPTFGHDMRRVHFALLEAKRHNLF